MKNLLRVSVIDISTGTLHPCNLSFLQRFKDRVKALTQKEHSSLSSLSQTGTSICICFFGLGIVFHREHNHFICFSGYTVYIYIPLSTLTLDTHLSRQKCDFAPPFTTPILTTLEEYASTLSRCHQRSDPCLCRCFNTMKMWAHSRPQLLNIRTLVGMLDSFSKHWNSIDYHPSAHGRTECRRRPDARNCLFATQSNSPFFRG